MARVYNLNPGSGADSPPKIDFDAELNPQQLAAVKAPPGMGHQGITGSTAVASGGIK
jgi:hypothetical protein